MLVVVATEGLVWTTLSSIASAIILPSIISTVVLAIIVLPTSTGIVSMLTITMAYPPSRTVCLFVADVGCYESRARGT